MKKDNNPQKASAVRNAADTTNHASAQHASLKAPKYSLHADESEAGAMEFENGLQSMTGSAEEPNPGSSLYKNLIDSDIEVIFDTNLTNKLEAKAFAQGNQIVLPRNFDLDKVDNQHIIGHEISHVLQNNGKVPEKTAEVGGTPIHEEAKTESSADAGSRSILKQLSFRELLNFVRLKTRRQSNKNKKAPAQRIPLHGSRTYDKHIERRNPGIANNSDYADVKQQFFQDIEAQTLQNIQLSKTKIKREFIRLQDPSYIEQLMDSVRKTKQNSEHRENIKKQVVGDKIVDVSVSNDKMDYFPGFNEQSSKKRRVKQNVRFDPESKPKSGLNEANNPAYRDRWDEVNSTYERVDKKFHSGVNSSPIIYALFQSDVGDVTAFYKDKFKALMESKRILSELLGHCSETVKKIKAGDIHPLTFEPVVKYVIAKKYKNKINYTNAIQEEKAFIDACIMGFASLYTLIAGIAAGLISGGWGTFLMATSLAVDSGVAVKSYNDYQDVSDAGKSAADSSTKLVLEKQISDAEVDLIINIGGVLFGFATDGREIFKALKTKESLEFMAKSGKSIVDFGHPANMGEQIKNAGGWTKFVEKTGNNKEIQQQLMSFRNRVYTEIEDLVGEYGGTITRTGSMKNVMSDLDASVLGTNSTIIREKIYVMLAEKYGLTSKNQVNSFLDMGLFGESKLKYAYDTLSGTNKAKVMHQSHHLENSFILNRLHTLAESADEKAYYKKLMDDAGIVVSRFEALDDKSIKLLNLEIDRLHAKLLKAATDEEKAAIILEINKRLTYVDISDAASYHTGAGVKKVNGRPGNDRSLFMWGEDTASLTKMERSSELMSHFSSYADYVRMVAKNPQNPNVLRGIGKYGERESSTLLGQIDKKSKYVKELKDLERNFQYIKRLSEILIKEPDNVKLMEKVNLITSKAMKELDVHLKREIPRILNKNNRRLSSLANKAERLGEQAISLKNVGDVQRETRNYLQYLDVRQDLVETCETLRQSAVGVVKTKAVDAVKSQLSKEMKSKKKKKQRRLKLTNDNDPVIPVAKGRKSKSEPHKPKSKSTKTVQQGSIPQKNADGSWSN